MALDRAESAVQVQTRIIGAFDLWFEKTSSQRVLWPATVALSLDYFDTLSRHAVPLDERAIAALAKSALALDAYCWLAQRLHRAPVGSPQLIPWPSLYEQFGEGFGVLRQFRAFFIRMLRQVHTVYPDAKFELDARGMRLWNSPPPITKRIIVITK
jgi:Plasmid encoded RepA protein